MPDRIVGAGPQLHARPRPPEGRIAARHHRPDEPDLFRGARRRQVRRPDPHHRRRTRVLRHRLLPHPERARTRSWPNCLERGYAAEVLHGDISQTQREKILGKFKKKQVNILVATDVAARGIDVSNLTHVINYSLPQDSDSYVHRIGRTGRAGNQGTAITFISPSEMRKFGFLKRDDQGRHQVGTAPHAGRHHRHQAQQDQGRSGRHRRERKLRRMYGEWQPNYWRIIRPKWP